MPELITPDVNLHAAFLDCHHEWGPGLHEDGFGLAAGDDVEDPAGFASWVSRLRASEDRESAAVARRTPCVYRWIGEGGAVLGGIALRHDVPGSDVVARLGHVGYGVRPSARRRGVASWALRAILGEARALGMTRVLIVCEAGNLASARTIESQGGVLESVAAARRYWVSVR
ncbi:MAG: GNAT family N-acetyltransferase [Nonomuraea sp.]|nr:GNAT family N-acetyltransferase [Nonomuraea sp.]